MRKPSLESGQPYPLGATYQDGGVNFALFSANAERIELCLFSEDGSTETWRLELPSVSNQVWHGFLPDAGPGTLYGYRVYGPYQPHLGHRFNPNKLLLDPYARQLKGELTWSDRHYGYESRSKDADLSMDIRDNAALMPKCVVVEDRISPPPPRNRILKADTLIYEAHVKGLTRLHPDVPVRDRGRFSGVSNARVLDYLKSLGITSIELLPVQAFISEPFLLERGLSNYWGYNTMSYFTPHQHYLSGNDIYEFRTMVDAIHDAGMEVILDIVFNHTAEGNRLGPTLSFKGIDNLSYYRLQPDDRRYYINDTGCGNTINVLHPRVIQMIMDCLRYWVSTMQVDGFRFDLAPVLGREQQGFDQGSGFFDALLQDPVLAGTKFIAEPWDIGPGGYQLGQFPAGWSEWNDRFRDTIRRFWRGDSGVMPDLARRIHGSSDIFEHSGRRPSASINFVTSHDGFTLADLMSYRNRHNELNLEDNQDGHRENYSDNYGIEGPTTDASINILRWRQQRNLLATMLLSQGTPMLSAGDELGRSQQGNNNAYCQDNELNWINWEAVDRFGKRQMEFVRHLIALRSRFRIFSMDRYIHYSEDREQPMVEWYSKTGELMQPSHWSDHQARTLGHLLNWFNPDADQVEKLFIIFHAGRDATTFKLPELRNVQQWEILFDTALESGIPDPGNCLVDSQLRLFSCSTVMLLARPDGPDSQTDYFRPSSYE